MADDLLTPKVANALERIARMAAENAAKAANRAIQQNGVSPLQGVVTAVDPDNKIYILRDTSINDDGSVGDPDPSPYQVLSPGRLPAVGDRVHGVGWAGGAYILGTEAGTGYVDAAAANSTAQAANSSAAAADLNAAARYPKDGSEAATARFETTVNLGGVDRVHLSHNPSVNNDVVYGLNTGDDIYIRNVTAAKTLLRLHNEGHVEVPYDIDMYGNIQRPGGDVQVLGNTVVSGELRPSLNLVPNGGVVPNLQSNFSVSGTATATLTHNWGERARIPIGYQDVGGNQKPLPAGGADFGLFITDVVNNSYKVRNNEGTTWGVEIYMFRP